MKRRHFIRGVIAGIALAVPVATGVAVSPSEGCVASITR